MNSVADLPFATPMLPRFILTGALGTNTVESGSRASERLFVTLWVMAFSFHYLDSHPLYAVPVIVVLAGLSCLLAPGSMSSFIVFLCVSTAAIAIDLPALSNHFVLALSINVILLGSVFGAWRHRRRGTTRWLEGARGPAVLVLVIVYFFAVLHKLNNDFFNPATSCTGVLAEQGLRLLGVGGGLPASTVQLGSLLTIGWESTVLVLLAVPRLQRWGVLIGIIAHTVLGLALFFDFATYVFAIYVLMLPEAGGNADAAEGWRQRAVFAWVVFVIFAVAGRLFRPEVALPGLTWHALQAGAWMTIVVFVLGPLLVRSSQLGKWSGGVRPWHAEPRWLLIVPVVAFANGLTPYLGLKTVSNYSMFSNLRTEEGVTNHLIPAVQALEVTDFLRDTVTISEFESPRRVQLSGLHELRGGVFWIKRQTRWLQEGRPVTLPWIELRRAVSLWKDAGISDIRIVYQRGDVRREVRDATADQELAAPLSWWARHFLAFRAIQPAGHPVRCRW